MSDIKSMTDMVIKPAENGYKILTGKQEYVFGTSEDMIKWLITFFESDVQLVE